jgi:4-amino-4-deoxy-L-arabinose transferase-like glycosyltransferase
MKVFIKNMNKIKTIKEITRAYKTEILIIFASALGIRLVLIILAPPLIPFSDMLDYDNLARLIATGHDFSIGRPIGYPFFLSLIYRLFGPSYLAVQFIQAVLSSLSSVMLFVLAAKYMGKRQALFTGWVSVIWLDFILYTRILLTETLFTFLTILLLFFLFKVYHQLAADKKIRFYDLILAGVIIALAALVRPVLLFLPFGFFLFYLVFIRQNIKQLSLNLLLTLVGMSLVLSPWIMRNYSQYGKVILVSDKSTFINVYMGTNLNASGLYADDSMGLPLPQNDHEALALTKDYVLNHPFHFVGLTLKKAVLFFSFYPDGNGIKVDDTTKETLFFGKAGKYIWAVFLNLQWIALVTFVIIALVRLEKEQFLAVYLAPIIFITYIFLIVTFSHYATRFRYPIMPTAILLASFGFTEVRPLWEGFKSSFAKARRQVKTIGVLLLAFCVSGSWAAVYIFNYWN